jgi:hypothetical protein
LASMAVCAPEGFRLGLAAEVAELGEVSSLDAIQEMHSRSLVEELDRTTRRYRLHALVRSSTLCGMVESPEMKSGFILSLPA